MKYYITYTVDGFEGSHQAGPYEEKDVASQERDIEGYMGVRNVQVVPENQMPQPKASFKELLDNPII